MRSTRLRIASVAVSPQTSLAFRLDITTVYAIFCVQNKLLTYDEISRLFAKVGCEALDAKHNETPDTEAAAFSRMVMSTSPHADDWASDLDDLI